MLGGLNSMNSFFGKHGAFPIGIVATFSYFIGSLHRGERLCIGVGFGLKKLAQT